jgi:hypothetical protein
VVRPGRMKCLAIETLQFGSLPRLKVLMWSPMTQFVRQCQARARERRWRRLRVGPHSGTP